MDIETHGPALKHFVHLASRGSLPGCSSGEHCAYQLARTMLLRAAGLDGAAIDGAATFLKLAAADNVGAAKLVASGR